MQFIEINENNIESEHICCAIGNDKPNKNRALTKKKWLKDRFREGLVFRRLNERGKVFIEYLPIEKAWKPVIGDKYFLINCLWVSGRFKGKGYSSQLLKSCIDDAKSKGQEGVAVISSSKVKPFLTDKRFFLKNGFISVDKAFPYFELLVLKFNEKAANPSFTEEARMGMCDNKTGLTFIYSRQCPFMEEYVKLLSEVAERKKISFEIIQLKSSIEAKNMASPFGTLGIYNNGRFLTHELMSEGKFEILIDKIN